MDTRTMFEAGNFVEAAGTRSADGWRHFAALGLVGGGQAALDGLARADDPEARLFHAFALWIDGQDDEARVMLDAAPDSAPARRLRTLLERDRIRVLAFLPQNRQGPHSIFGACHADPRFQVDNVWFFAARGDGLANHVDADIHHFYSARSIPDLMICEMVEWHVLPRNLHEARFFKVGHTSDFDIHAQEVMPWIQMFDAMLTLDHTELGRLRRALPGRAILTYPKVFTVRERQLPDEREQPIDVLMTGTVHSDYHQDKNELVSRLTAIPGLNRVLLNGFVGHDEYERLVQQSKLTLSFVRHSGTMPTRALESLALGTWCVLQHDSALRLYLPEDAAIIPYTHGQWDRFAADISDFLARYPDNREEYVRRVASSREALCRAFAPERVASQYLRFCAALPAITEALAMETGPVPARPTRLLQKRGCVTKGWLPAHGDEGVLRDVLNRNLAITAESDDYTAFNDAGREQVIEYARLSGRGKVEPGLLEGALTSFRTAIKAAPAALAPRFNLIRSGFHFGDATERRKAAALARETLELHGAAGLSLAPDDDLLPYDFYPSHFNAQQACEQRLDAFGGDLAPLEEVKTLIAASIHYYLARFLGRAAAAEDHYRSAIDFDPDHAHFQIGYAEYLLSARPERSAMAVEMLRYYAGRHNWTPDLGVLTDRAGADAGGAVPASDGVLFLDIEDELARQHHYRLARCLSMTGERFTGLRRVDTTTPRAALVLTGGGVSASERIRRALTELRTAVDGIEIVLIETMLDVEGCRNADLADLVLSVPQPGAVSYVSQAIHLSLAHIRAPYLLIVRPELVEIEPVIRRVTQLCANTKSSLIGAFRPLLISRNDFNRAPSRVIECVGVHQQMLATGDLPQRIGMLQGASLALPILTHQLRRFTDQYYLISVNTGQTYSVPSDSEILFLDQFVTPCEDTALRTVSPDWRRFCREYEQLRPRPMHPSIEVEPPALPVAETASEPDAPAAEEEPASLLASRSIPDGERSQHHLVMDIGRTTGLFRLARYCYRRILIDADNRPRRFVRHTAEGGLAVSFGLFRIEYLHPRLRLKFQVPGILASMLNSGTRY